jgi:C4-dicarboxylate transporter DctQ subunit
MIGRIVGRLEEGVIALLLAAMTLVTFSQVVARYVFNTGAVWALELTQYLFAWLVLFGMSYGVRVGAHIGVDAFVRKMSSRVQRYVGIAAALFCMGYAGIVFVGSWNLVDFTYVLDIESEDLPIPQWVPYLILPIGFGLLFLRLAQVAFRILAGRQHGFQLADEAAAAIEHGKEQEEGQPESDDGRQ